ncbi:type I polyketide synthase [Phytohabitans rumicis]|uniref:Uncharacterized protein n=1 Tax=Phytohabitans rumicis TaxID=1076125 RepID=A0A6V8L2W7_9ACTN|nr:type I polyketide synthase [Phytohabitans rumicis]GFJ91623.1 hypothetical protein Prum_052650 [Phytohabitans rumicis]
MTTATTQGILPDSRQVMADALRTIERLRRRIAASRDAWLDEPIAIVGMGCRFPGGADTPEAFWHVLRNGVDTTGEFPPERADARALYDPDPQAPGKAYTIRGGFLGRVDRFEPEVFGISPREALGMDPQQRLALEVCWEALERAGYAPDALEGTRTGVYLGMSTTDYVRLRQQIGDINDVDAYQLVGEPSFTAGRISYVLGLRGPSKVVDTSCSSSLVAVHEACQALRLRECDLALAGGVNMLLAPYGFVLMSKFGALAADGRCKTFDETADGYARGEGAGVVALKRLADAEADGDHVIAIVRGSAVNHDGRSSGLTVPSPAAQQEVIAAALAQGRVDPADVDYVEAHGTGTALGDPIELRALQAAVARHRPAGMPLLVGSVKTNIGHLEPAAGVASLIKLALAIEAGEVPPHLHLRRPNPNVDWQRLHVQVPGECVPWPDRGGPRIGAVSSFGASGTNAHAVLASAVPRPRRPEPRRPYGLFLASARTEEALRDLAAAHAARLRGPGGPDLHDACFTSQVGRAVQARGLAVEAAGVDDLADALSAYARGGGDPGVTVGALPPHRQRRVAWLFTGADVPYAGTGDGLFAEPAFGEAFEQCAELLDSTVDQPEPALFALQYALAAMWLSWGLRPAAVAGYGVGEIVAGCVAGALALPDAAALVAARARSTALPAVNATAPAIPMVSTVTGDWVAADGFGREHWAGLATGTGRFAEAVRALHVSGCRTFLELGPVSASSTVAAEVGDPEAMFVSTLRAGLDDQRAVLRALGALCVRGARPDWAAFHDGEQVARVPLPTTPWRGDSYWFREAPAAAPPAGGSRAARPGDEAHRLPGPVPAYELPVRRWAAAPVIDPAGRRSVPLGALVDAAVAAARDCLGGDWPRVSDVDAPVPVPLDEPDRATVRLTVTESADGSAVWEVFSQTEAEAAAGAPWQRHAHGRLRRRPDPRAGLGQAGPVDAAALPAVAHRTPDAGFLVPVPADAPPGWAGVLDAATAAAARQPASGPVTGCAELTAPALSEIRYAYAGPDEEAVTLLAADGTVAGHVRGLRAGGSADGAAPWRDPDTLLHEIGWHDIGDCATDLPVAGEGWLVVADPGGDAGRTADRLATALRAGGAEVTVAASPVGGVAQACAPEPDAVRALVDAWRAAAVRPVRVALLTGLDAPRPPHADAWALDEYAARADLTAVALVRELAGRDDCPDARVTLVTRGAVPAAGGSDVVSPAGATLWGLGRVLALEHPDRWGGIVDLDPDPDGAGDAEPGVLLAALADAAEDQQAVRAGRRLAARLVPSPLTPAESRPAPPVRADGTYLVTGAFGGIGAEVAGWLARAGAGRLVLLGRTPPPERPRPEDDQPGDPPGAALVRRLRGMGADVVVAAADVTDEAAMARVFATLDAGPRPLRGVVHAAGVSGPQFVREVEPGEYRRVWRPKVIGGWQLHQLCQGLELDFFLGFSSIAATWGSQHLASYAAGNAFLDGLAEHRAAQGAPALSVSWGPWDLPTQLFGADVLAFLRATGLRPLSAPQCLRLLGGLLAGDRPHRVVSAVDWSVFKPVMQARTDRPMLSTVEVAEDAAGSEAAAPVLAELAAAGAEGAAAVLTDYLRGVLGGVLGADPATLSDDVDLMAYGLDSLMVMEVVRGCKRDLRVTVRASDLFERSSLGEWADYLAGTAGPATEGEGPEDPAWIAREVALDPAIRAPAAATAPVRPPREVLLTGATGFVGAYLLAELLAKTPARVHCLVRADDPAGGLARLRSNMERYLPWPDGAAERVVAVPGDLARPMLGLPADRFEALAGRLDAIYHNGAWVNFSYTYDQLRPANVEGTAEILRLACGGGRLTPVHHVSTYGIWGIPQDGRRRIAEGDDLASAGRLVTGYAQTKWAAERLVELARERGVPVAVYRPGRVLGDSRTGACLTTHFTTRVIKGCLQLGMAPDLDIDIEMTPVDYVATSLVRLSLAGAVGTYHLVNGQKMAFRDLVGALRRYGWPVPLVPVDQWWDALRESYPERPNELHPVMDLVEEFIVGGEEAIDYDDAAVEVGLAGTGILCPPLDDALLQTYLGWLLQAGYLPAPAGGPSPSPVPGSPVM